MKDRKPTLNWSLKKVLSYSYSVHVSLSNQAPLLSITIKNTSMSCWLTCFIMMKMGAVVYLELIHHAQSCCRKYSPARQIRGWIQSKTKSLFTSVWVTFEATVPSCFRWKLTYILMFSFKMYVFSCHKKSRTKIEMISWIHLPFTLFLQEWDMSCGL